MKRFKSFFYSILLVALLITPIITINNINAETSVKVVNVYVHRVGCKCCDGRNSSATGRGACSHHGGVRYWKMSDRTKEWTGRCD
jgi:hypothetical protein